MDEDISNFVAITAASPEAARGFLEMAGNNLEAAIQLFFENPDIQNSFTSAPATGASTAPPIPASTRPNVGRQNDREVIHIDSDDDGDTAMTVEDEDDDPFGQDDSEIAAQAQAAAVAQTAQEEEDAAMARRLQEELYGSGAGIGGGSGGGGAAHDDVRSPIGRTTETLVGGYDADDGMDMDSIIRAQMRQREATRAARGRRSPVSNLWGFRC